MKLKFYCTDGTEKVIADVKDLDEADKAISKYLEDNNIKCYYARHWIKDGKSWTDFGSHTEFFVIDMKEKDKE